MKKTLSSLILFIITLSPVFAEPLYTIKDMDTIALFDSAEAIDINDRGQALLRCKIDSDQHWAIWDPSFGLITVDNPETPAQVKFEKIANSGQLLGTSTQHQLVIWDAIFGYKTFDVTSGDNIVKGQIAFPKGHSSSTIVATLRNCSVTPDQKNQIFIWERGKIHLLDIDDELQSLGYEYCSPTAIAVNEHGDILGKFTHWKKHSHKDKLVECSPMYFVWDGSLTIIEKPAGLKTLEALDINNNGDVLVLSQEKGTGLWNAESGLSWVIASMINNPATLTDNQDLIVSINGVSFLRTANGYHKYRYHQFLQLCEPTDLEISPPINIATVNRAGWLIVKAEFLKEQHPFLLVPINES